MIKEKHIAITGTLAFYKREEAFFQIRIRGGIPQDNVGVPIKFWYLHSDIYPAIIISEGR